MHAQVMTGGGLTTGAFGAYILGSFEANPWITGGSAAVILAVQVWALGKLIPIMLDVATIKEKLTAAEARDEAQKAEIAKLATRQEKLHLEITQMEARCKYLHGNVPANHQGQLHSNRE